MDTKPALRALSALAHESRLTIYRHLVGLGPAGTYAGALAEQVDLPAATLSFHLKELRHAELARVSRKVATFVT